MPWKIEKISDLPCSVFTAGCSGFVRFDFLQFLISVSFPADPAGLLPKLQLRFPCLQILVPDRSVSLALRSSLRFYASEEARSRTGKNERSDELEG
ncbi:hypothetical protein SLEP1_g10923 [Rubroshorea leprosula]|uniref:Uncharacterized protein n=1 Tax=Rubroshorea leprosula TaxID=152421 RepID=A0AAV5IKG8_9ROSI|nr:hypothetical protein SLEP1_g10923 [Rubroshorea leprosula]